MKYVFGLGNFADKYVWTRHNIGFAVVENAALFYANASRTLPRWADDRALDSVCYAGSGVTFLRPKTFVNQTGRAVRALVEREKAAFADLLIVCDDVNLEFGKMRVRASGSSGGHHGLESIVEALGSEEFCRLRIGVGRPDAPKDLTDFVLQKFDSREMGVLNDRLLKDAASICREWIEKGFDAASARLSLVQGQRNSGV